jgi:hypothetical protein
MEMEIKNLTTTTNILEDARHSSVLYICKYFVVWWYCV